MKIKELNKILAGLDENFEIELSFERPVSQEELSKRSYKFPYDYEKYNILGISDVGYSDKVVILNISKGE